MIQSMDMIYRLHDDKKNGICTVNNHDTDAQLTFQI